MSSKEKDFQPNQQRETSESGVGKGEHPAAGLYADADLSKRHDSKQAGVKPVIDVEGTYGNEAQFLKTAPAEIRKQVGLPASASPEQLYHKMAEDFLKALPKASAELKHEAMSSLRLDAKHLTEDNVYQAFIARDRRETGTADGASLADLERNVHKRTYKMMKDGTMPIDYD